MNMLREILLIVSAGADLSDLLNFLLVLINLHGRSVGEIHHLLANSAGHPSVPC